MDDLLAARLQMAISLGFHIIFACIGMVMPFFMATSHSLWLRNNKPVYLDLTKAWSKGVAIFFATGAVSGTLLSFELGLLWPTFMLHAGPIFGLPFSWEGTAFFLEAIALGIFLYGWNRIPRWIHWSSGIVVGISGLASGILVVAANGWMNSPTGFSYVDGNFSDIDPVAAFFNPAWFSQALHMSIAAFEATGFAVAGIHAALLLKNRTSQFHKVAIKISLTFAALAALIQPLSGDLSAKFIASNQPAKFAAMEAHFKSEPFAPLIIGGLVDSKRQEVSYALKIPGMLSFLAHGDFSATVQGLDQIPPENWPPVIVVHSAFQIMIACGVILALTGLTFLFLTWRGKRPLDRVWFLKLLVGTIPLGFIAVETGWVVTEVGRQPWIIYGIMRTEQALTPMPGIVYSLVFYTLTYLALSFIVFWLLLKQIHAVKNLHISSG